MAVYALLPIGMGSQRAAISQTTASQIFSAVYADLLRTPTGSASAQFGITDGTTETLYFDAIGNITTAADRRIYRLTVSFPGYAPNTGAATQAHLLLTWPGFADPAEATGTFQLLAAFDRN